MIISSRLLHAGIHVALLGRSTEGAEQRKMKSVILTTCAIQVQFVREFLNIIDLLAIAPFVFEMVLVVVSSLCILIQYQADYIIYLSNIFRSAFGATMCAKSGQHFWEFKLKN
jgi:hypothetical protein